MHALLDLILHLDIHLNAWAGQLGPGLYLLLFAIVFCETGLVVTPFLPGDSLLFAVGALSMTEGAVINPVIVIAVLIAAAVLGDATNYSIGRRIGPRVFTEGSRWLNKEHLLRTQAFYEKHGGKTIILARFIPIIRTFAPFVAGIGQMRYRRFFGFNVVGGAAWVIIGVVAGCLFGRNEWVKGHFSVVVIAIVVISLIPVGIEFINARRDKAGAAGEAG